MAAGSGSDPGELLAKALDLAVGSVALARYAAGQTSDRRLRRTFRHLAATGEHQAIQLRRQLAGYAARSQDDEAGSWLTSGQFIAGAAAGLAAVAAGALTLRILLASPDDGLRRAAGRALGPVASALGIGKHE